MGNGAGAKACLIGEDTAGDALLHTDEETSDDAAGEGRRVEGPREDGLDDRRKALDVQDDNAH